MKTNETEKHYAARASLLISRVRVAVGCQDPSSHDIAEWLLNYRPFISRSTWRQYRAALIYFFENTMLYPIDMSALKLLREADTGLCKRSAGTSNKKQKSISETDLIRLVNYFDENLSIRHSSSTKTWLLAGLWTGLRPSEWRTAKLTINDYGVHELQVRNAKHTNGRGHGETRILHLVNMTSQEIDIVNQQLKNVGLARRLSENSIERRIIFLKTH